MTQEQLIAELFRLQDAEYRALQLRLIPTVQPETVIGVRTPALRRLDPWTHNKTIQKAVKSDRITPEQQAYLITPETESMSKKRVLP